MKGGVLVWVEKNSLKYRFKDAFGFISKNGVPENNATRRG